MKITVTKDDGEVLGIYEKVHVVKEGKWYVVYSGHVIILEARDTDQEFIRDLVLYNAKEE